MYTGFASDLCSGHAPLRKPRPESSLVRQLTNSGDFAILQDTAAYREGQLQLRADFFNILNHPNFANPVLPAFIADPAANINQACTC